MLSKAPCARDAAARPIPDTPLLAEGGHRSPPPDFPELPTELSCLRRIPACLEQCVAQSQTDPLAPGLATCTCTTVSASRFQMFLSSIARDDESLGVTP
eukprot:5846881-Alexandrium_andersonii.AAC.1